MCHTWSLVSGWRWLVWFPPDHAHPLHCKGSWSHVAITVPHVLETGREWERQNPRMLNPQRRTDKHLDEIFPALTLVLPTPLPLRESVDSLSGTAAKRRVSSDNTRAHAQCTSCPSQQPRAGVTFAKIKGYRKDSWVSHFIWGWQNVWHTLSSIPFAIRSKHPQPWLLEE